MYQEISGLAILYLLLSYKLYTLGVNLLPVIQLLSDGNTATLDLPTIPECLVDGSINSSLIRNDFRADRLELSFMGPIEFCINGQYEILCDIGWDELDAQALCNQQGTSPPSLSPLSLSLSTVNIRLNSYVPYTV